MMLRERRRAAHGPGRRAGAVPGGRLPCKRRRGRMPSSRGRRAQARRGGRRAATAVDAEGDADLDAVYRDLGVRRGGAGARGCRRLPRTPRRLTAERETAPPQACREHRRRSPTALPTCRWWRGAAPSWRCSSRAPRSEAERRRPGPPRPMASFPRSVADEAAARAAVGTAVQSRDAARAAMDEARDAHRALSVEIATLEEMERASARSAGEARAWLVEHVDEVLGLCEPLSHVIQASAGFEPLVESLLGGDVATLLVEDAGAVELIAGTARRRRVPRARRAFLMRDDAESFPRPRRCRVRRRALRRGRGRPPCGRAPLPGRGPGRRGGAPGRCGGVPDPGGGALPPTDGTTRPCASPLRMVPLCGPPAR